MGLLFLILVGALVVTAQQAPYSSDSQFTLFHHPIKRVAVIGAGPSGLQSAAKLIEHNFTVRLFDRSPSPGGNWHYTDDTPVRESYPDKVYYEDLHIPADLPSTRYYEDGEEGLSLDERWREHWNPRPVWDSLTTNSPAITTELPGVPYAPDAPWVLPNRVIQTHVRAFASLHNLNVNDDPPPSSASPVTSYSTRVENIEKINATQTWKLTLRKLERLSETNRIKAHWWTEEFDALVIATGPFAAPHVPVIEGIIDWSKATENGHYSLYHSQTYRRPQRYQNKTVLVVGSSISASEIARDIGPYVRRLIASVRPKENPHPYDIRSLSRFPNFTEFVAEIERFEPLKEHSHGIKEGVIHLLNGTILRGIDEIILATGYVNTNIFLRNKASQAKGLINFHWTGHYIPDPTVAFTNVRPYTMGKYQSYLFAKVWEGTARLPSQRQMQEDYENKKYARFGGVFSTPGSEAIYRQYIAWINNQSLQYGGRFVEPWPVSIREVFAYYSEINVLPGYVSSKNFTDFESRPSSHWLGGEDSHFKADVWDAVVYDDDQW